MRLGQMSKLNIANSSMRASCKSPVRLNKSTGKNANYIILCSDMTKIKLLQTLRQRKDISRRKIRREPTVSSNTLP